MGECVVPNVRPEVAAGLFPVVAGRCVFAGREWVAGRAAGVDLGAAACWGAGFDPCLSAHARGASKSATNHQFCLRPCLTQGLTMFFESPAVRVYSMVTPKSKTYHAHTSTGDKKVPVLACLRP